LTPPLGLKTFFFPFFPGDQRYPSNSPCEKIQCDSPEIFGFPGLLFSRARSPFPFPEPGLLLFSSTLFGDFPFAQFPPVLGEGRVFFPPPRSVNPKPPYPFLRGGSPLVELFSRSQFPMHDFFAQPFFAFDRGLGSLPPRDLFRAPSSRLSIFPSPCLPAVAKLARPPPPPDRTVYFFDGHMSSVPVLLWSPLTGLKRFFSFFDPRNLPREVIRLPTTF